MLFRYYITDIMDGCIKGTNDEQIAEDYGKCDDCYVVDAQTGEWITFQGREKVKATV